MGTLFIKPPIIDISTITKGGSEAFTIYPKSDHLLLGRNEERIYRVIMQFDLSSLPFGLNIVSAKIINYIFANEFPLVNVLDAYQILSKYTVRDILRGKPLLVSSFPVISTQVLKGDNFFLPINITSLMQKWYSGSAVNLGVLLKVRNENIEHLISLRNKEYLDTQKWPMLEINYIDRIKSACGGCDIVDLEETSECSDEWNHTTDVNVICLNYSYIVFNSGTNTALAVLQQSADGEHWQNETAVKAIAPGQSVTFIPNYIIKYARLSYKTEAACKSTTLKIYMQGRAI